MTHLSVNSTQPSSVVVNTTSPPVKTNWERIAQIACVALMAIGFIAFIVCLSLGYMGKGHDFVGC